MKIENLLISAGAMKAGTSWLYKQIEMHDEIETVPVKEIHYFAHVHSPLSFLDEAGRIHNFKTYAKTCDYMRCIDDIARHSEFFSRYLKGPIDDHWYENLFTNDKRIVKADFSNMACILDGAALTHMKSISSNVRVIYTLRDPLARLWSHVKYHASVMNELENLSRFSVQDFISYFWNMGAAAQSNYADNIVRLRAHFAENEIGVFFFEDFMTSPQKTLNDLLAFVGVSRKQYDESDLRAIHNEGPSAACTEAFLQAAAELLLPQALALREIGIEPHPDWSYVARLEPHQPSASLS